MPTETMRALVVRDGDVHLECRRVPQPGPIDAIIRTTTASLCSADVACVAGTFDAANGTVLGHEAVGIVHAVGGSVRSVRVGDRVAVAANTPCGACIDCQRGFDGHCGGVVWGGYTSGVSRDGSLAEFFAVPHADRNCTPIPDGVPNELALCVTDSIASGFTGPEMARIPLGGNVVVLGQGHIGLSAVTGARLMGAGLVIAVKATPGHVDTSIAMGADLVLNLAERDVVGEVRELTGGVGADCVVEATGVVDSFPRAVALTRTGGTVAVLSSYSGPEGIGLSIPLADWGWGVGDKTILSTMQRSGSARLARLLRLVEMGRLDPSPLLTHRFAFDDVVTAFRAMANRQAGLIKPVIVF